MGRDLLLSPLEKDLLVYAGASVTGAVLAHSFQAKLLGVLIGGTGGLALAAWLLSRPHVQTAGESPLAAIWKNRLRHAGIHVQQHRPQTLPDTWGRYA